MLLLLILAGCAKPSLKPVTTYGQPLEGYALIKKSEDRIIFIMGGSVITLCDAAKTIAEKTDGVRYDPCRQVAFDLSGQPANIYVAVGMNPNFANYFSFVGGPTQSDCDLIRESFTRHPNVTVGWTDVPCRPAILTIR
jgi:hypothetical protein